MMTNPIQKADMLPATKPDRMVKEAPPSRAEVTTSRTCRDPVDVNEAVAVHARHPGIDLRDHEWRGLDGGVVRLLPHGGAAGVLAAVGLVLVFSSCLSWTWIVLGLTLLAIGVHSLGYNSLFEDPMTWGALGLAACLAGARAPRRESV